MRSWCQLALFNGIKHRRTMKRRRHRRFWVRPGRTAAWWDNFVTGIIIEEEWKENFRMCRTNFNKLYSELHEYIQREETVMHSLIDVERQVAMTLYYLSDEGRLRKTANAFGVANRFCYHQEGNSSNSYIPWTKVY